MSAPDLERLNEGLRAADRDLLRALAARAALPREPGPKWVGPAESAPPLAELVYAVAPAGTAADAAAATRANQALCTAVAALRARAAEQADGRFEQQRPASQAALENGDRERMGILLADVAADLQRLESIRAAAADCAPPLPDGTAGLLWREFVIPWTRQLAIARLMEPGR
jgi:hypothetical protein